MERYYALIDGEAGGYGIVFPDLPGCTAMGATIDEAIGNAAEALRDCVKAGEARKSRRRWPRARRSPRSR